MRFLRPAFSILHREKIRSTYACEAGVDIRSRATGVRSGYTTLLWIQKLSASTTPCNGFIVKIPQVESCCDLGILVDDKLSFSVHILSVAKKASSKSFLIRRCFQSKNPSLLSSAFTSYVCLNLEYLSPVWSPYSVKDIEIIENVHRRFPKLFPHLHSLPCPTRLTRLGLSSLQARRIKSDLCSCYKIIHSLTVRDPLIYFSPRNFNVTRGHLFMSFVNLLSVWTPQNSLSPLASLTTGTHSLAILSQLAPSHPSRHA